jgi:hypothetical protein
VRVPRRLTASLFITAGLVAASVGVFMPAGSASTKPPAAKLLNLTAAQRQQLLKLYASYRHLPLSDVARVVPGSAHGAVLTANGQDWAAIMFAPSAHVPQSLAVRFQDGANIAIFARAKGGVWKAIGLGGEPLGCAASARLPSAVRPLWHLAACPAQPASTSQKASTSQRASAAKSASNPAAAAAATASNLAAAMALGESGVQDNPAETNFNGLDCNPFTAFEFTSATSSGCGTNGRFQVKNRSEFWCADFAKWVWAQAGVTSDLGVLTPSAASFYTWGKDHGETMTEDATNPKAGDAVVFYPGTTPNGSYADHVGIVTAVNSNGTVNLANGDFLGSSNISVQENDNVSLKSWSAGIWGSGEDWAFVSPQLSTPGHAAAALNATQSGKCVDTAMSAFANGTKEETYTCNGGEGQQWTYTSSGQLTVDGGQFCLDVKTNGTANSTVVDLWTCNGGANQQWSFGPGHSIVGTQSGKCLNVSKAATANDTQLIIYTCNGAANEEFTW